MADLADYLQRLRQTKPNTMEKFCSITDCSLDNLFSHQQPDIQKGYCQQKISDTYHPEMFGEFPVDCAVVSDRNGNPECNSVKETERSGSRSKSISSAASTSSTKRKNSSGTRNRKNKEKEGEKEERVVHVRAKRGQATDSHSIAERMRREKINSKLRCLQEIVPGCHKSMGMAVMLEEIINYVHSLQNQVEFLSMELAAASSSSNSNINTFPPRKAQGIDSPEAQELQKWPREGFGEVTSGCHYSTWSI